jgi:hypothetical protein
MASRPHLVQWTLSSDFPFIVLVDSDIPGDNSSTVCLLAMSIHFRFRTSVTICVSNVFSQRRNRMDKLLLLLLLLPLLLTLTTPARSLWL